MKKFENPEILVEMLEVADVIAASVIICDLDGVDCVTDMGMG